jgi:exopolysaccharide production protein ExoQ
LWLPCGPFNEMRPNPASWRRASPAPARPSGFPKAQRTTWLPDHKYATLVALMLFAMLVYMSVPGGVGDAARAEGPDPNVYYRIVKFALLVLGTAVTLWRISLAGLIIRHVNAWFLAFVGLVALSAIWSITPSATLTRLVAIIEYALVSLSFVLVGWHAKRFQNVLRPTLTLLLLASLIFGVIAPDLGKEAGESISLKNAWRGVFTTKNLFGEAASLGTLFWVHGWLSKEVKLWSFICGVGIAGTSVILSRSSTAIFATVFVVLLLLLLMRGSGHGRFTRFMVIFGALAFLIYAIAALNIVPGLDWLLTPITALTGKDASFSGRTAIWDMVREHISRHPILGTGYGAYWIGLVPSSDSYIMLKVLYFMPNEAHNGYLDIINDLGYVGFICLMGYLVVYVRQCFALLNVDRAQAALYLALLFQQLVGNLTESMWWYSSSLNFVVMTIATFALARTAVDARLHASEALAPLIREPRQAPAGRRRRLPVV